MAIFIHANQYWNDTGISLTAGKSYWIAAAGRWHDAWNCCDADGYPSNNWVLRQAEGLRRAPAENWFKLMGTIGRTAPPFPIGKARQVTATADGNLYCFANDVWGLYFNNWGVLELTITLL